jgi:hypothetical protein
MNFLTGRSTLWPAKACRRKAAALLGAAVAGAIIWGGIAEGAERKTERVVLVTIDGVRQQELFGGIDPVLMGDRRLGGVSDPALLRRRFWRDTPEQRRVALMPFFWTELAPRGVVLGNRVRGSRFLLKNPHRVSYPGYSEILTGEALSQVTGNDPVRIPRETVLEFVQRKLDLSRTQVAVFASWEIFRYIVPHREGAFLTNAGYQAAPPELVGPEIDRFNRIQSRMLSPWNSVRHDLVTTTFALQFLRDYEPVLLYVAPGEPDDWGHERRYDRMIESIRFFDDFLRELWQTLQSLDAYRDKTTLIIATDHGRGLGPDDWTSHGRRISGAEDVWLAVVGPDTPALGDAAPAPTFHMSDIAATLLRCFGLDGEEFNPNAGPPIPLVFR